jgi:hypothetical protein
MPLIRSEYSCPRCKKAGVKSQIVANLGQLMCEQNPDHSWVDTFAFYSENPVMEFKVEIPKNLPQQNHAPMTVSLPIGMEQALSAKYGDRVNNTVASVLQQMLEGDMLIIGKTDYDRLAQHIGKNPGSAGELVGMVYAMKCESDDQKQIAEAAAKDLKAYESMSPGRVVVDLGSQLSNVMEKARDAELPLKLYVERKFLEGIENGWF